MLYRLPFIRTISLDFKSDSTCSTNRKLNSGNSQGSSKVSYVSIRSVVDLRQLDFKVITITYNNTVGIVCKFTFNLKVPIVSTRLGTL